LIRRRKNAVLDARCNRLKPRISNNEGVFFGGFHIGYFDIIAPGMSSNMTTKTEMIKAL